VGQRRRVFQQQRQVAGSAFDGADEIDDSPQDGDRVVGAGALQQHQRHQPVQPLASGQAERTGLGIAAQLMERPERIPGRVEPQPGQDLARAGLVDQLQPDAAQLTLDGLVRAFGLAGFKQHPEVAVHRLAVPLQRRFKLFGSFKPHRRGQPRQTVLIRGQLVGLPVGDLLEAMLDGTQKHVGIVEFTADRLADGPLARESGQHGADAPPLQGWAHPPADQLEDLPEKLDFANSPAAELDVCLQALARHLLGDHLLHRTQGFEGAEIQVAAVHERVQPLQQGFACRPGPRPRCGP
jgi:hypothetical protein